MRVAGPARLASSATLRKERKSDWIVGSVTRGYPAIGNGRHDFDDEFWNLAAGSADWRRVARCQYAAVCGLREVHQRDPVAPLTAGQATVCADDAALKRLQARMQTQAHQLGSL
jgi:hypothetical protein